MTGCAAIGKRSRVPSHSRLAHIRGMLWWPSLPAAEVVPEIDAQQNAGFDILWLCGTQHLVATDEGRAKLGVILSEADRRGMEVIFETWTTPLWYHHWDPKGEIKQNQDYISRVWKLYGAHQSLRTWYIGHEIYLVCGDNSAEFRELYRGIVHQVRATAPAARVAISPFFILDRNKILGDFCYGEPDRYAEWWAETLRQTGIDLLMIQDSGEHASFTTIAEKEPFIAAYAAACREAGAEFWVNVETAEMDVPGYEALREARKNPTKDQPWRPVPIPRLREKLELAGKYSPHAVTWGWEFWRPALGPEARTYFQAFSELNTMS